MKKKELENLTIYFLSPDIFLFSLIMVDLSQKKISMFFKAKILLHQYCGRVTLVHIQCNGICVVTSPICVICLNKSILFASSKLVPSCHDCLRARS